MKDIIKVFHFHNGSVGGVRSVIRNLLLYKQHNQIENHVVYTINRELNTEFELPKLKTAASEQVFYYSPKWNFSYTCKKLSKLLTDEKAVIVAHDWLELGMVSHLGLSNPVIHILHGDYEYYYDLSVKHHEYIDAYVTVAKAMAARLNEKLSGRTDDIYYLPFPVPNIAAKNFSTDYNPLNVIFIGRLTKEKGYDLLPEIDNELRRKHIKVKWHIVGAVSKVERSLWLSESEIEFYDQQPNEKVIDLMQQMDCLVLPSLAEGMPVTVVEAMKVGLTCLVNDLRGGINELLIDGVTGYRIKNNTVTSYANIIGELNENRLLLERIGGNARAKVNKSFDPVINTIRYEEVFQKYAASKRNRRQIRKIYGSRLDRPWIPNFITRALRSF